MLVYFLIAPESKTNRRKRRFLRSVKNEGRRNSAKSAEKSTDTNLKMPEYYEEIVENDKLKKNYLNLHQSI